MEDLINLISNKVIEDSEFNGNMPIEFKITDNIKEEIDNYYENNKHSNIFQDFSDLNGVFCHLIILRKNLLFWLIIKNYKNQKIIIAKLFVLYIMN